MLAHTQSHACFKECHIVITREPLLFQSSLYDTSLFKRPTFVPVFDNQNKSEEDFHFHTHTKQKKKVKITFSVCFAARHWRLHTPHPSKESGPTKLLGRSHTQHLSLIPQSLNGVCEHLCFIFSKMCPKVMTSSLYTISAQERFSRKTLLSERGARRYCNAGEPRRGMCLPLQGFLSVLIFFISPTNL